MYTNIIQYSDARLNRVFWLLKPNKLKKGDAPPIKEWRVLGYIDAEASYASALFFNGEHKMNKEKLEIVYLKKSYQEYIKKYCKDDMKFVSSDNKQRPFVGVVLRGINGSNYFAPLTNDARTTAFNEVDVHNIGKGKYGALNFKQMLPVPEDALTHFDINSLPECSYKRFLVSQARHIQRENKIITTKAAEVYVQCLYNKSNSLYEHCNDFLLLEDKAKDWKEYLQQKSKKEEIKIDETKKAIKSQKQETPKTANSQAYRETKAYKTVVEKYGQQKADKLVNDLLKIEISKAQEKEKITTKDGKNNTISVPKNKLQGKTTVTTTVVKTTVKAQPKTSGRAK